VLAPLNQPGDRQGNRWDAGVVTTADGFKEAYASFCETGWNGMPARREFGGQGMPTLLSTAVLEMWKSANMAFSPVPDADAGRGRGDRHHGSETLKQRYLPPMVEGRWTGTMNLTEPQAGSDLAALRTKAVPEGDHYRISGTKIFITWGEHDMAENIVHLVLARLPDAPAGVKGISLFLVPEVPGQRRRQPGRAQRPGLRLHRAQDGHPRQRHRVMSFGEGPGAIGYLVGEEHQGLACMFTMMNHARLASAWRAWRSPSAPTSRPAATRWTACRARPWAREGEGANATIIGHPDVRRMLMDMKARTEAHARLAYFAAGQMDRAHGHADADQRRAKLRRALVDLLIPVVKGWCTEGAQLVTATGVQVHGGMGFIEETGAAQHQRDARITTIYEGTTGIQANDLIGRKLARDGGAVMKRLIAQMRTDASAVGHEGDALLVAPACGAASRRRGPGRGHRGFAGPGGREAAAAAVPYLWLAGTVIGGWLMTRAAVRPAHSWPVAARIATSWPPSASRRCTSHCM
jgi:alkylation response protein AidB-like acyl-CoA dehydrogenase